MDLNAHIKEIILQNGTMSVAHFMQIALYHPKYGYYYNNEVIGKNADFITAPEISQIFGEMVAIWVISMWQQLGEPRQVNLVEIGPGLGTMMVDMLRAFNNFPNFKAAMNVTMVETSPYLKSVQQEKLSEKFDKIIWQNDILTLPQMPTIFVANELFDALPISQFVKKDGRWFERRIALNNQEKLSFALQETVLAVRLDYLHKNAKDGDFVEISTIGHNLIRQIGQICQQNNGAALLIDYGYTKHEYQNTLQALKNHQYHDILSNIGSADITAHVDFISLVAIIKSYKLVINEVISMGKFLTNMGIEVRNDILAQKLSGIKRQEFIESTNRLIDPRKMGELFKVLTFYGKNF